MNYRHHTEEDNPYQQAGIGLCLDQGLSATHVARRCAVIEQPEARAAIWLAQLRSWWPGGLPRFLKEMYRALKLPEVEPDSIPVYVIDLESMCLDRECAVDVITEEDCYGNRISVYKEDWTHLKSYRRKWISELPPITETSVSQRVFQALDYTKSERTLTLIDGPARIGKTFSARSWCDRMGGLARYVQVPCSDDDVGFFRAIARALGISAAMDLRASDLRNRIEEVVQKGDLTIVFDESQYCWSQSRHRHTWPFRVNWILQALVNFNVPVALVTTPIFYSSQKRVEEQTGWTSEQLIGRISHIERLPSRLCRGDLVKVAKALLPAGDAKTWDALAAYADLSKKHLASIEAISKRTSWLASQDGAQAATAAYVRRAMEESVIPSDTALAESLAPAAKARRNTFARPPRVAGGYAAASLPSPADYTDRRGLSSLSTVVAAVS